MTKILNLVNLITVETNLKLLFPFHFYVMTSCADLSFSVGTTVTRFLQNKLFNILPSSLVASITSKSS